MASSSKLCKKEFPCPSSAPAPAPAPAAEPQSPKAYTENGDPTPSNQMSTNPPAQDHPIKPIDTLSPPPEDLWLSKSSHLTRQELRRRRLHRLKQLSRVYRDHYWALMEELRVQYREYYWRYGVSPYKVDGGDKEIGEEMNNVNAEGSGETNHVSLFDNGDAGGGRGSNGVGSYHGGGGKLGLGFAEGGNKRCVFVGCKLKAMALTNFCHLHILSDPQQKLYKACNYVIKSAQAGPIMCGKPILRSMVPSMCNVHFQKAQKHATRALRKVGLNVTSSSKLAPKFHVIVAEYVSQIQARRRTAERPNVMNIVVKDERVS
ncbi:hypothetical protein Dimus_000662 [Dionaea muscipula]